ncbi:hypothetical protein LCGC14_2347130 [marine sediment metagenome]|uniref:Uncharacterized protein n=1 Tax=marine sediment metagenome TaxID=412755 RepID=A0A0F9CB50_9ZZZZ
MTSKWDYTCDGCERERAFDDDEPDEDPGDRVQCADCERVYPNLAELDAHNCGPAANECCPVCNGVGEALGSLGQLTWYRCRACGSTFEAEAD